jgi:ABC-type polar amino acid transport system ATPase subunit
MMSSTTPPSTRSAAPEVAEACCEQGPAKTLFANPQQPRTRQFLEKFLMQ